MVAVGGQWQVIACNSFKKYMNRGRDQNTKRVGGGKQNRSDKGNAKTGRGDDPNKRTEGNNETHKQGRWNE